MHQKVFDYIHVAERQEFQSQLHWVMNPGQQDNDEDVVMGHMYSSEEPDGVPPELSPFLTRCFIARVRCLLDSTSGFLANPCGASMETVDKTGWAPVMPSSDCTILAVILARRQMPEITGKSVLVHVSDSEQRHDLRESPMSRRRP
ncbi:aryl hydrocarbon receptor repressor-like isoform X1 [Chanodichthys erythropterus]|uniref:aryl hydrocarbon receptor repressor-like isoform X1 n=1 Tax=Chanodichthys erythropterus TaxID=933992 RepID=UPI00351F41F0